MDGLYNIAIADLGGASSGTTGQRHLRLHPGLAATLSSGLAESLGDNLNILIWHDSLTEKNVTIGPVNGSNPEASGPEVETLHKGCMPIWSSSGIRPLTFLVKMFSWRSTWLPDWIRTRKTSRVPSIWVVPFPANRR
jgi:hypothetical protein